MEQYVVRSASVLIKQCEFTQLKSYLKLCDWKSSTECNISLIRKEDSTYLCTVFYAPFFTSSRSNLYWVKADSKLLAV